MFSLYLTGEKVKEDTIIAEIMLKCSQYFSRISEGVLIHFESLGKLFKIWVRSSITVKKFTVTLKKAKPLTKQTVECVCFFSDVVAKLM